MVNCNFHDLLMRAVNHTGVMEKLLQILTELHSDVDFENHTTLIDDSVLDSFDIITIVGEVDSVFDVQIPADKLVPENFNSAAALWKLIESLEE